MSEVAELTPAAGRSIAIASSVCARGYTMLVDVFQPPHAES